MKPSQETTEWLLEGDVALRWQVERDILGVPSEHWKATRALTATEGFAARLLSLQDADGQWAGGAYFPGRIDERALADSTNRGQPYIATTWSLNSLREWGVAAEILGDTDKRLEANSRWEYDDLPYWQGEVDCCINSFTLSNGLWLGRDMSQNVEWFLEHQLADGGWNCDWVEGATRSSFHSTLNALIALLDFEIQSGKSERVSAARETAEEYLLSRKLMFGLASGELVGDWVNDLAYPFRWSYSVIRALNYFKDSYAFSGKPKDARIEAAEAMLAAQANSRGRWSANITFHGQVWFEVDAEVGEESRWLTFFALRALASSAIQSS